MATGLTGSQWLKLGLLLLIVFGGYGVVTSMDLEELLSLGRLVEIFDSLGWMAPFVFILVMALSVVISPIPSLPLDLTAGIVFGPWLGTAYAVIGALIGAIVSFVIGRRLGREVIAKLFNIHVVFCEKCSDHHLLGLVFLARLLPIFSFDLVSYGAGLTKMSLKGFAVATCLGMIPPTFALTYLGKSVVTMEWPVLLAGLALTGAFLVLPKFILNHRSAWWARLLQGKAPGKPDELQQPEVTIQVEPGRCQFCGGPM